MTIPNIKPISDLRNYTEVLKEVSTNQPVYLTRNGRGAYAMNYMVEIREIPVLVIEAKKSDENLEEAYSEARLYAEEINECFRTLGASALRRRADCRSTALWAFMDD